jgi:hypothetical protein
MAADNPIGPPITLEQFAGVTAALAEGFELAEVLEQEVISTEQWIEGSRVWPNLIAGSTDVYLELIEKRRVAEDCLGRKLAPLDDDPVAWMGLMGALATATDRSAVMEALGITAADMARLGRQWKEKGREDEAIRRKLEEAAATATPPQTIDAGPRELRPFPWTPPKTKAEPEAAPEATVSVQPTSAPAPQPEFASYQREPWLPLPPASTGTEDLPAGEYLKGALLPFNTSPVATPPPPASSAGARESEGGTMDMDAAYLYGPPLPFVPARVTARGAPPLGCTEDIDSAAFLPQPALPFAAPAVPELTPAQYAWIVVSLRLAAPERLAETLARFRLTPERRKVLDDTWQARMAADPSLAEAVDAAIRRIMLGRS